MMEKESFLSFLDSLASKASVSEGGSIAWELLVALHRRGSAGVRDLAREIKLAPPLVSSLLDELHAQGLVSRGKKGTRFTPEGLKYVETVLEIRSLSIDPCGGCDSTGINIDSSGVHQGLWSEMARVAERRPPALVEVDQAKCTVDTMVRRCLFLHARHALDGTSVLFLGDDDFTSVAASSPLFIQEYFIPSSEPSKIHQPFSATVLDIDERIVTAINSFNRARLRAIEYDAREPLPGWARGSHDVVFTDPPYTLHGAKLFLSRAIDALRPRAGTRVFLSFGHVAPGLLQQLQEAIVTAGFLIDEIIPLFNEYEGGNIIGNASMMMVLVSTGHLEPFFPPDERVAVPIYTAES